MAQVLVAKRYAKALVDLAVEKGILDTLNKDLSLVTEVMNENPNLVEAINSPVIETEKKISILAQVLADNVDATTSEFLTLLVSKGREVFLKDVIAEFDSLYKAHKGIHTVEVITAVALTDSTRQAIIAKVKEQLDGTIVLDERVDANIIGGMVLRIGDKQFDASISSKLNELEKRFSSNL